MRIRLTREFSFEAAHALRGYQGLCSQIHGHSYRLSVTVRGEPLDGPSHPRDGMLMDFGMLKALVNRAVVERYDHTLLLRADGWSKELTDGLKGSFERVELLDWQPTCENMVARIAATLQPLLPPGVELFSLRLHETANSFAEWFAEDQNISGQ